MTVVQSSGNPRVCWSKCVRFGGEVREELRRYFLWHVQRRETGEEEKGQRGGSRRGEGGSAGGWKTQRTETETNDP